MADSANFALHRPELLDSLTRGEANIRELMARDVQNHPDDTILIQEGSAHNFVYRVRHGWAGRVRTLPDGRSQFILIFLPGDLFAVKSMFVSRHPDRVVLLSRATIERVDHRELRQAYSQDPDIALRCTWQVIEEERRLHNWVVSLGRGNADERLAALFCDFFSRLVLSGAIARDARSFQLPLTQEQLSDHLGISAVHTNRVLKTLRDDGLIELKSRQLTILDYEGLAKLARPLLDIHERTIALFKPDGR
jgi:CRP/FNR family transcriptional regulator